MRKRKRERVRVNIAVGYMRGGVYKSSQRLEKTTAAVLWGLIIIDIGVGYMRGSYG